MKIKCIIIDDEPLAIKVIEKYLLKFLNFEIVAKFNDPISALSTLRESDIDVIFLDINMSSMNGLEFIKTLESKPKIIITTAYRDYAVESYELHVFDYLVKPIPFNRFLKSINKITQHIYLKNGNALIDSNNFNSFIFLKVAKKLIKVRFDDIFYIESLRDYIKVITPEDNYLVHKSLTSITEELPSDKFLRINRSFTIAIDKVKSIEGNLIEISSKRIPIGRKYVNHVKQVILKTNIDNVNPHNLS